MKVLLVNNSSDTWQKLQDTVLAAGFDATPVHHSEVTLYDPRNFDLVILSGGWWYDDPAELLEKYADELELIKTCPIPIFGICIGMQLMHVALDQSVPLLAEPQHGYKMITLTEVGQKYFGMPETYKVFKNHTMGIIETDPEFEQLAYSPGHTEIMRHRTRPLIGVQFHPEMNPTDTAASLLHILLKPLL